jgi:hypothetical protein
VNRRPGAKNENRVLGFWSAEFEYMTARDRAKVKSAQRCAVELAIVWEWKALRARKTYNLDDVSYKFVNKSCQYT